MDEDYSFPTSSSLPRSNKSPIAEEETMDLLSENGQIVMQNQYQRPVLNKRPLIGEDGAAAPAAERRDIRSPHQVLLESTITDQLFMQEDEMAFWLHNYPVVDTTAADSYSDEIDPVAPRTAPTIQELRISPLPTTTQPRRSGAECLDRIQNFVHISRPKARTEQGPSISNEADEGGGMETGANEMTSSSGDSEWVRKKTLPTAEERKRKGREGDNSEWAGEAVEFESPDAKKQNRGLTYAKKSRASEVHNLSERRRRDRINEKMRALQELIPRCNKSDKASVLDEAIEYLKSLQLQVQMMSMGCSMVPMMFPGVQQYMPPMGMSMGMSRPMLPFPSVLASSALPTPAAAAHMDPRFPVPAFHMPSVPLPGSSNQSDPVVNSLGPQNLNQPRMMNFPGPYPQYVGLHHTQLPMPQNQAMVKPSTSKPSISREVENHENLQSG